jgi:hypothetical protein
MDLFLIRLHIRRAKQGITASSASRTCSLLHSSAVPDSPNKRTLFFTLVNQADTRGAKGHVIKSSIKLSIMIKGYNTKPKRGHLPLTFSTGPN